MSSSDSETVITESLPIPKLIEIIKYSFRECEFNEVQNVLMNREKNMKNELERLIKDHDSIKEEVVSLERSRELQKLNLEEKLQRSERKCRKLNGTIARLIEEHKNKEKGSVESFEKVCEEMGIERNKLISENERIRLKIVESEKLLRVYQEKCELLDRRVAEVELERSKFEEEFHRSEMKCVELKQTNMRLMEEQKNGDNRSRDLHEKVCEENSDMKVERNKLTSENERINQTNMENEKILGVYEEKCQLHDRRLETIELEKFSLEEELRRSEMKCRKQKGKITRLTEEQKNRKKLFEELYEKACEENLRVTSEKNEFISENERIKQKNLEIEQLLGVCQEKFQSLEGRLVKIEQEIECLVHKKMAAEQIKELGEKQFEAYSIMEGMLYQNLESSQTLTELRQNELDSGVHEDNGNRVLSYPDSSSHSSPPQADKDGANRNTGFEGPQCSVIHGGGERLDCGVAVRGQSISKTTCSSTASGDVMEVCDSDDGINLCENKGSIFRVPLSNQKNKQVRTEEREEDSPSNLISKGSPSVYGSEGDKIPSDEKEIESLESTCDRISCLENDFSMNPVLGPLQANDVHMMLRKSCASETHPVQKFSGLLDDDSMESEDESCSDSYMNNLIATLQSKNFSGK